MEIRLNLKQVVFVGVWMVILVVALVLSVSNPYSNALSKAKDFGYLIGVFGLSFTLMVIGLDSLTAN